MGKLVKSAAAPTITPSFRGAQLACALILAIFLLPVAASLPALAAEVPIKLILSDGTAVQGKVTLEGRNLSGSVQLGSGIVAVNGRIHLGRLSIKLYGPLTLSALAKHTQCTAEGSSEYATGDLTIPMSGSCGNDTAKLDIAVTLPSAASTSTPVKPQPDQEATIPPSQSATSAAGPAAIPAALASLDFGRYEALVIGNDRYQSGLPILKTAVSDAQAIAQILKAGYGFKVTVLLNATRDQIIGALSKYRQTLTWDDNLLIYYAGHGSYDQAADQGYWLPIDAVPGDPSRWVSNTDITNMLKAIQARHVMVVADSCYSGTLTRGANVEVQGAELIQRMVEKKARTVMTSGGLEPVADAGGGGHSVFASAFIAALQQNAGVMDAQSFFAKVREPVVLAAPQTPEYSNLRLAGHEGGDFVFVRKP